MKPRLRQTIARSCLLRCPECGQGQVAKNWRETYEQCLHCGFDFCVEGGFYLGSIYLNYGLLAVIMLAVGMPLVWFGYVSPLVASAVSVALCALLALWFWRYARSLWLGLGYYIDHSVRAGTQVARTEADLLARHKTYLDPNEDALECACPYCHTRFRFAESRRNSWCACAFCHEKILLIPVRRAQPGDSACHVLRLRQQSRSPRRPTCCTRKREGNET